MNSQTISMKNPRVETLLDKNKDTVVQIKLNDAKIILKDLLDKKYVDSLLVINEDLNCVNEKIIQLDKEEIKSLEDKNTNNSIVIVNLNEIIKNGNETIGIQKKEIKKQKFLKYLAFISTITLGILVITK